MNDTNTKLNAWLIVLSVVICTPFTWAEPYLAQRFGQKCSACHVNISGGGMRSAAGAAYAVGLADKNVSSNFSPQLAEAISIGANFRGDWTYTQYDEPAEVSTGETATAIEDTSAFNVSNGTLYLGFALSEDIIFYLDQQVAPEGGRTREAIALYKGLFGDLFARAQALTSTTPILVSS